MREPRSLEEYAELREELEERQAFFREFIDAYDGVDSITDLTRDGLSLLPTSPQREFFKMALGRDLIESSDTLLRPFEGYLGISREQTYFYAALPMLCLSTYNSGQALKVLVAKPSRVQLINGRKPINAEFANKVYPLEGLPEALRQKYPHSVPFTGTGHPDFSRYAIKKVQIDMTGVRSADNRLANRMAGLDKTPEGYTWHHHQDGKTMLLVPEYLHDKIKHTGGVAIVKHNNKGDKK